MADAKQDAKKPAGGKEQPKDKEVGVLDAGDIELLSRYVRARAARCATLWTAERGRAPSRGRVPRSSSATVLAWLCDTLDAAAGR